MKNTGDKLRILGILTHFGDKRKGMPAVDWWRVKNPLDQLKKHGHYVKYVKKEVIGNEEFLEFEAKNYDIIFSSYLDDPKSYAYIRAACDAYGCRHIMDVDDNLLDIDEMNPARIHYHPQGKPFRTVITCIADVDILTVTTPHLKETYSQLRGGKPIVVLPNYIDPNVYKYEEKLVPDNGKEVVILYFGSATHHVDIMKTPFIWALRRVLKKYPFVKFACMGTMFEEFYNYLPKDQLKPLAGARHFPLWVGKWKRMPGDIGVAPLYPSAFNRSKSSIKYYEYSLRKIPGVYAFWEPYLRVVKEGKTGFLAQDEEEWVERLSLLIEDKKTRLRIAENARNDVLENYTIQDYWQEWEKLFLEAREK